MQKTILAIFPLAMVLFLALPGLADVKIRQRMTMAGQKFETTRMIKGSRERTEQKIEMDNAAAALMPQIATITQCDLRRTVRLNDRKRIYLAEPFAAADDSADARRAPAAAPSNTRTRAGGTMTFTYSFRDTGERKTMFGLQARRLIMTQEIENSADSCGGASKSKMEFDGWYADFSADFSCPVNVPPSVPQSASKPDCIDRIVVKGNGGAARTGFLLEGTMTMYGPDGKVQMTQTTETLELSREPLSASLFDVPQGYTAAASSQELYAMPSMGDIARAGANSGRSGEPSPSLPNARSVGVNLTLGSGVKADRGEIESYIIQKIRSRGLNAAAGSGDLMLNVQFRQIKESAAGKIGGLFGKVTGVDTGKVGKVDIDMTATLLRTGGKPQENKVKSKFDGPLTDAVRSAIDEALDGLLDGIEN